MKNGNDRAKLQVDIDRIIRTDTAEFPDFAKGETAQQVRSDDPICKKCPRKRVAFTREHTRLKRKPATITCPNCLQAVETVVKRYNTSTTHLAALLLSPVCLCLLPYCSKALRDSVHRCPSCGINLGSCFASAREAFVVCLTERQLRSRGEGNVVSDYPPSEQSMEFF